MKTEQSRRDTLLTLGLLAVHTRWILLIVGAVLLPSLHRFGWLDGAFIPLSVIGLALAVSNLGVQLVLRRWVRRGDAVPLPRIENARRLASTVDLVWLSAVLYWTGGPDSAFFPAFLLAFILIGVGGTRWDPLLHLVTALVLFSAMFAAIAQGWLPWVSVGPTTVEPVRGYAWWVLLYWGVLLAAGFLLIALIRREFGVRERRIELRRRQLDQLHEFQGRILEHLPAGVVAFGAGGRITSSNPQAHDILELKPEESQNLLRQAALERSGLAAYIEQALSGQVVSVDEFPFVSEQGTRWLRLRLMPPRGEMPGILLAEDIGELKAREEREQALQERLAQADKFTSLGQMASGVAHELNNPLTAILGAVQMLQYRQREGKLDDDAIRERLAEISLHGQRIETLIRGLLTYARPRREPPRALPLGKVVDELLAFSRQEIERDGVELEVRLEDGLPEFLGSKTEIQQLILNLLTNARHVVEPGHGRIGLELGRVEADEHGRPVLRIIVRDNGPGIDPDVVERIFEPFFTTKDPDKGTGLGLAIVHAIVEHYRGRIRIETAPGEGTCFHVELPYHAELPDWEPTGEQTFSPYH